MRNFTDVLIAMDHYYYYSRFAYRPGVATDLTQADTSPLKAEFERSRSRVGRAISIRVKRSARSHLWYAHCLNHRRVEMY